MMVSGRSLRGSTPEEVADAVSSASNILQLVISRTVRSVLPSTMTLQKQKNHSVVFAVLFPESQTDAFHNAESSEWLF